MDRYIEFQRFPDFDAALGLIDFLNAHDIPFQIDDSAARFDIASTTTHLMDNQIIIKINEAYFDKTNLLYRSNTYQTDENSSVDHYLYTFSDNDIIDVIANPEEWTELEVGIAKQKL
jgi:hypothetical protein